MDVLGRILRTISLAILFGGSAAVVFAAITLVKAAEARGVPVPEAAAANAPLFIHYAKINLAAGVVLLIGEALDYAKRRLWNRATMAQYACSILCVVSTMIFALAIVPPMERLLPEITKSETAHAEFNGLHKTSRIIFGATILLALTSLILPVFGALQPGKTTSAVPESA
jgi:hypothetical protein